jgi:hypothetical protein
MYVYTCKPDRIFREGVHYRLSPTHFLRPTPTPREGGRRIYLLGHASITMTLDRYSQWIPSMGRHAADGMDEALGE